VTTTHVCDGDHLTPQVVFIHTTTFRTLSVVIHCELCTQHVGPVITCQNTYRTLCTHTILNTSDSDHLTPQVVFIHTTTFRTLSVVIHRELCTQHVGPVITRQNTYRTLCTHTILNLPYILGILLAYKSLNLRPNLDQKVGRRRRRQQQ